MTTETPIRLMTAEEFWELPEPEHGGKVELLDGRVVAQMAVGGPHSELALDIGGPLRAFSKSRKLGSAGTECGFVLHRGPDLVRVPDVHFVRRERLVNGRMPPKFFDGAPDLAIEISSPDDRDLEVALKVRQYQDAGTSRVWVVRAEDESVMVFRPESVELHRAPYVLNSDDAGFDVEGFELPIASLFEPL